MNNWIATRRKGDPTAKWVFHENDAEWGLGLRPQGYVSDTIVWAQGSNFMLSPGHNGTIAPLSKLFNGNNLDPNSTTTINGILDSAQGRKDFVSAVEEILNFEFSPAVSTVSVDTFSTPILTEVAREATRWIPATAASFTANWPNAVNTMKTFLNNRPNHIRGLMQSKFAISGTRNVTFQKTGTGTGRMQIYGRTVDLPWTGTFFDGSALNLTAMPGAGSSFVSWSGAITSSSLNAIYNATTGSPASITLDFGTAGTNPLPNDVIFNEYWLNDTSTTYTDFAYLEGDWLELLVVSNGTDLRGWRVTNNLTKTQQGAVDDGDGSLIFPNIPGLASVPSGTIVLVVSSINTTNSLSIPTDDLDASDRRLVFYRGNGNINDTTDPGFGIGSSNEALTLLAPGATASFADDIGIDFISEGSTVTPTSFFGAPGVLTFTPVFTGIGNDDGCYFTNSPGVGFNNDDGTDVSDGVPGAGGWVMDPPATFSGDSTAPGSVNNLTRDVPTPARTFPPCSAHRWRVGICIRQLDHRRF